jgi:hypothetical protein
LCGTGFDCTAFAPGKVLIATVHFPIHDLRGMSGLPLDSCRAVAVLRTVAKCHNRPLVHAVASNRGGPKAEWHLTRRDLTKQTFTRSGHSGGCRPDVGTSSLLLRCPKAVIGRRRRMEMLNGRHDSHPLRLGSRDAAVRDIRALEEAGLPYRVNSVPFCARNAEHCTNPSAKCCD